MLKQAKRRLAVALVGRPWLAWLGQLARPMIHLGYLLRLLEWTARNDLRKHLLDRGELPAHVHRFRLYDHLRSTRDLGDAPIWYLEFGVAKGESIGYWSKHNSDPASRLTGYDSFEGLPEAWAMMPRGGFSTGGTAPATEDQRVAFVKGWFKDTVAHGLPARPGHAHRMVVNLDADLYGSTAICLHALYPHLRAGDILIFDELAYPMHEYRSMEDFIEATGIKLSLVAAVNCGDVAAFEVGV